MLEKDDRPRGTSMSICLRLDWIGTLTSIIANGCPAFGDPAGKTEAMVPIDTSCTSFLALYARL